MKGMVATAIYASFCAGFLTGANFTRGWVQTLLAILGGLFFFIAIWCGVVWGFACFQFGDGATEPMARLAEMGGTASSPKSAAGVIAPSSAAVGATALLCLVVLPSSSIYVAGLAIAGGLVALHRASGREQGARFVDGLYAFSTLGLGLAVAGIYLANHHHW
jgi:hypothetical protein